MNITYIIKLADEFTSTRADLSSTYNGERYDRTGKMVCHDALHSILQKYLSDDEWENEDVEDDVLLVQKAIKQGDSLDQIISDLEKFIPEVSNLTEEVVQIMHYFFNVRSLV